MRRAWLAFGVLAVFSTGCSVLKTEHRTSLYQAEIDRLSAEKSIMDRELRDERIRRERAEAIVVSDREFQRPEIKVIAPAKEAAPAQKEPRTAKPKSVKEVQQALSKAGYYKGPVDGKYGRMTREAVVKFQRDADLKADGKVGARTWKKLGGYLD